ncbi:MAG: DMT family transporter [Proteobacteria bacterium]|nr:DMT family transporter [Pseudomonadota bacterium]
MTQALAWPGAPLALLSAALFGASTPLAKMLLGDVGPWMLAGLLYLGAGVGLSLIHLGRRVLGINFPEAPLRRTDLPWLAAVVLSGGVLGPVLLMVGLAVTPAASASLLLNLEGLFTLAIAWVVFRENVDLRIGLGAAAILLGALLVSWQDGGGGFGYGALAIAGACLCWGIDNNLTRKLSSADPLQIVMVKGLTAGTVNVALALFQGASPPASSVVLSAAVVGLFGYGVSIACFVLALRHLGSARTGAYFASAPFIGALLSVALLSEPVSVQLIAAAALMAIGLYLHLVEHHEHDHEHEEIVHEHAHVHDEHHRHSHISAEPAGESHVHVHRHVPMVHRHPHYPDIHHRHSH